ncbi:phosphopantothenoylcysteine decarboxylase [Metalysinibacillus jejuensis]|uniref:phosphopantothenoylcysteine decarboxylase domain-containing protein n=1 Tax=Metalysinibacillus jejuensis TaxID=914327 RepID=UPI000D353A25|nr:phosphopantothenoylcysteine decarboxylase [Metalysinibacillus jejuensis]
MQGKKVLITSGGTLEKWDNVRGHTNLSKGIMGCYLAEEALKQGAQVIYLHGYFAKLPINAQKMTLISFEGIEDLGAKIKQAVQQDGVDIVIMAAAGSDWLVDKVFDRSGNEMTEQGKMPSDEPPIIHFKKAPKILAQIKTWQPTVTLVGFKLEATTDVNELVARATKRMASSQASFMVANSAKSLYGEHEPHWIINASGDVVKANGKEEAAVALFRCLA